MCKIWCLKELPIRLNYCFFHVSRKCKIKIFICVQDERLDVGDETPLNPASSDFSPEEELQCDAEVQKITGTTTINHSNDHSNDRDALLSQDEHLPPPPLVSTSQTSLNNNNNNRKDSLNSPVDVNCVQHGYHGNNKDNNSIHGNHLDNSPSTGTVPTAGLSDDCSTHTRTPQHHGANSGCHGYKDDVIDETQQKHQGGTSQNDAASSNCERHDSLESLSDQIEHFVWWLIKFSQLS